MSLTGLALTRLGRELSHIDPLFDYSSPWIDMPRARLIECAVPMTTCDEPEFHYRFGIRLFIERRQGRGAAPLRRGYSRYA